MLIFDLTFTDGKACRYLCPDPDATEATERASLEAIFCGRLASMVRIIAPPPEKLPWRPVKKGLWRCNLFVLKKLDEGSFNCFWPGGEVTGGKDEISAAVRANWHLGC